MIDLHDIRYVRLGTPDLDAAVAFATAIVGLQLVRREANAAYFRSDKVKVRGDTRDHTLVYFVGDPADQTLGIDLRHHGDLDALGAALERAGRLVHLGTAEECDRRRVKAFIATNDPSGNRIEFLSRAYYTGERYFPARDAGITGLGHVGLYTSDPRRDEPFWTELVGARVSDYIGDSPFLRLNTVHHSIVLFPARRSGIEHINHEVEDIDDVMRAWYFLREKGVRIVWGPGRHPISSAMMLYFEGPDGVPFEYSTGARHIAPADEAAHRPRQFAPERYNRCMWGSVRTAASDAEAQQPLRMVV